MAPRIRVYHGADSLMQSQRRTTAAGGFGAQGRAMIAAHQQFLRDPEELSCISPITSLVFYIQFGSSATLSPLRQRDLYISPGSGRLSVSFGRSRL